MEFRSLISDDTITLAKAWLSKASDDIASARKLADPPNPLLENTVYHCQQAVEKAIKAILALHGREVPFTHDIAKLLRHAKELDPALAQFEEQADLVTTYATEYRYPDFDAFELTRDDIEAAISYAGQILASIRSTIFSVTTTDKSS